MSKVFLSLLAVGTLLYISAPIAHAADHDDDDSILMTNRDRRPIEELFKTDVVFPEEKGELQTEVSTIYQNHPEGQPGAIYSVPLSLEYGITANWQVETEWNSFVERDFGHGAVARGIGDLELGTQYSFLNVRGSLFHISPLFTTTIPLGDVNKDLSQGFMQYEPALVVARDFPDLHHSEVFSEIGAGFVQRVKRPADPDDAEPAANELEIGAGFFTMFKHSALTMEFNYENNQWNHGGDDNELYVTPGILWRPRRNVEVGLGIPVGLNSTSDRFDVSFHFVWEFD